MLRHLSEFAALRLSGHLHVQERCFVAVLRRQSRAGFAERERQAGVAVARSPS